MKSCSKFVFVLSFFVKINCLSIPNGLIESWATKFSDDLATLANYASRKHQAQSEFNKWYSVEKRHDEQLAKEIAENLGKFFKLKIDSLKKIVEHAEKEHLRAPKKVPAGFKFTNTNSDCSSGQKEFCSNFSLTFPNHVNTTMGKIKDFNKSLVHIAIGVNEEDEKVLSNIYWSESLDSTFKQNLETNPFLVTQFFASSTGFSRRFPGVESLVDDKLIPVDLYDARTRPWYAEAATGPKDLIILLDRSGSMNASDHMQLSRLIVTEILDTLSPNDYFNVLLMINGTVVDVIECFKDILLQANSANILFVKEQIENLEREGRSKGYSNYLASFKQAFSILKKYGKESIGGKPNPHRGACCSQAIILITDTMEENFYDLFQEHIGWPESPVRVFTFLIAGETADIKEMQRIACKNRGYFMHLNYASQIREKVLEYLPVMARPMVLTRHHHPVTFSSLYPDLLQPVMTDHFWGLMEGLVQREIMINYKRMGQINPKQAVRFHKKAAQKLYNAAVFQNVSNYNLMITVSMPVFNLKETKDDLGELLGVTGIDIRLEDIKRLLEPFRLGPDGYAFLITNNGHVLFHPYWDFSVRFVQFPIADSIQEALQYKGVLKPNFNAADFVEVEQIDDGREARDFNDQLLELRERIVQGLINSSEAFLMKFAFDEEKRLGRMYKKFFCKPIPHSPFTLVLSIPAGSHKDVRVVHQGKSHEKLRIIGDCNWRIHPDWLYCSYIYPEMNERFPTNEDKMLHFLRLMESKNWKWNSDPFEINWKNVDLDNKYFCDRDLVDALIVDLKRTEWFKRNSFNTSKTQKYFLKSIKVEKVFISTRSGLTRWIDVTNDNDQNERSFGDIHSKSLDQVWYRRAVFSPHNFIYSVPFNAGGKMNRNKTSVFASHAITVEKTDKKSVVAVVGFTFSLDSLKRLFENTILCKGRDDVACFLIDEHGYVILSNDNRDVGLFFGAVKNNVMNKLVKDGIYKKVSVFQYQEICLKQKVVTRTRSSSTASPFQFFFFHAVYWVIQNILFVLNLLSYVVTQQFTYNSSDDILYDYADITVINVSSWDWEQPPLQEFEKDNKKNDDDHELPKNRRSICDKQIELYIRAENNSCSVQGCKRPYALETIRDSNLQLVVVDLLCLEEDLKSTKSIKYIVTRPSLINNMTYDTMTECHMIHFNNLTRNRPKHCYHFHTRESEIVNKCGDRFRELEYSTTPIPKDL